MNLQQIKELLSHISFEIFGTSFYIGVHIDKIYGERIYIQVEYAAPCTHTGRVDTWKGGKHYLSEFMTEDEIVKKAYVAFEQAVKHEIMEGFKFEGIIVFNPHINFRELIKISHKEIKRT